jgi:drug/metabolite transporter (DMT)-like permease
MRGLISTEYSLIMVNTRVKYVMWDSVPSSMLPGLLKRSIQAALVILINFTTIRNLSLVFMGMCSNLTPIATVLMSFIMNGEKLKAIDLLLIFITFIGVTLITIGYQ